MQGKQKARETETYDISARLRQREGCGHFGACSFSWQRLRAQGFARVIRLEPNERSRLGGVKF